MNYIQTKKRQFQESAWLLGICERGFDDLKENRVHWISNGKYEGKKWFADPFILNKEENAIHLLVEEFDYKVHRGRIAKLTINRENWIVEDCKIVLDLPTHLSFPMIWRENGIIYVCPENYKSGGWNMYRYDELNEKLEFEQEILKIPLTDSIILNIKKSYYILSTFVPTPSGSCLSIWQFDKMKGTYDKVQDVTFNENIARNAGMIFCHDGEMIRPAQECNETYGHALSFQQVCINDGLFSFKEKFRWYSIHPQYCLGCHTYNQHEGMAVIDVKGYRYPIMGRYLKHVDAVLEKIHLKKPYKPV
ncbi:MAG: hypothetical protein Q4A50_06750 [Bacteroidales bacterium]|nr:hypothetical protein [Bacteroidales bacterium]